MWRNYLLPLILILVLASSSACPTPVPTTGAINVYATLNGSPWSGSVNYDIAAPTSISGTSVPQTFTVSSGTYKIDYLSGGPAGATFTSTTPSQIQTLTVGGVITFTLNFTTPFAVTSVTVSVNPPAISGPCPQTFTSSAVITVNGPGTVTYQWERSDGVIEPVYSLAFTGAGSQTVAVPWLISASCSGWRRVHILTPNDITSNQASFTLTCTR